MSAYYITNGITTSDSIASNTDSTTNSDSGSGSGISAEMLESFNTEIVKINAIVTSLTSKVNNLTTIVNNMSSLQGSINGLITQVGTIQQNTVTPIWYEDTSSSTKNVYNTQYINGALETKIPRVYNDYAKDNKVKLYNDNEVYSVNAIREISNIESIPTVFNDIKHKNNIIINPTVYSTTFIDNSIIAEMPEYKTTFYINGSGDDKHSVYTSDYINELAIPSSILSERIDNPNNNIVYNASYINELEDNLPNVINTKSELLNVDKEKSIFTCSYIQSLSIPSAIMFDKDSHTSNSSLKDTTESNIYDTYYIDRSIRTNESDKIINNSLMMKIYNKKNRSKIINNDTYTEIYGDDSITYMFTPSEDNLSLYWFKGDDTAGKTPTDRHRLLLINNNGTTYFDNLIIGDSMPNTNGNRDIITAIRNTNSLTEDLKHIQKVFGLSNDEGLISTIVLHDYYNNSRSMFTLSFSGIFAETNYEEFRNILTSRYGFDKDADIDVKSFMILNDKSLTCLLKNIYLSYDLNVEGTLRPNIIKIGQGKFVYQNDALEISTITQPINIIQYSIKERILQLLDFDGNTKFPANSTVYADHFQSNNFQTNISNNSQGRLYYNDSLNLETYSNSDDYIPIVASICHENFNGSDTVKLDILDKDGNTNIPQDLSIGGMITQTSDINLKHNIKNFDTENFDNLHPIQYMFKNDSNNILHYGLIAQELEQIFPTLVKTNTNTGYKSVNYIELIPILINKVQKQDKNIEKLWLIVIFLIILIIFLTF